jgi:hypothetical protein
MRSSAAGALGSAPVRVVVSHARYEDLAIRAMAYTLLHRDSHAGQTYITASGRVGLTDWQVAL